MKRVFRLASVSLILIFLMSLTGCVSFNKPDQVVSNTFQALKAYDLQTLSKYLDVDKVDDFGDMQNKPFKYSEDALKAMFSKLNAKVISSSVDGNCAIVKTEVTNISMKTVFDKSIAKVLSEDNLQQNHDNNATPSQADIEKLVIEFIKSETTTVKNTVDIKLNKVANTWNIEIDENFQDAVFGGLLTMIKSFSTASRSIDPLQGSVSKTSKLQRDIDFLNEVMVFVYSDIWEGLHDISSNIKKGLSIDSSVAQIGNLMFDLEEYNFYIKAMTDPKTMKVQETWSTIYSEILMLYTKVKINPPIGRYPDYEFDTELFDQYVGDFCDYVRQLVWYR